MKKMILYLALFILLAACVRNPVTGKREIVLISESQEIAMGRQADGEVRAQYGLVENRELQSYVDRIGKKLAAVSHRPNLDWHFTVVDSPVVNAFALPGGYIYFTRGILAYVNSEAELAGVLGHEIGHVTARHSVRQLTRAQLAQIGVGVGSVFSPTFGSLSNLAETGLGLLFLKYGRDDERESDRLGVEYAARSNYDPRPLSGFFEVLQRLSESSDRETIPGWLSTHPDPPERVKVTSDLAREWIGRLNLAEPSLIVGRDSHLDRIEGMVFGDNPREGFTENDHFYHPDLEFQITFPAGWKIENTRAAVMAIEPNGAAVMQVMLAPVPEGTTAQDYARDLAAQGLRPLEGQAVEINGNRAFIAIYSLQGSGGNIGALGAFIEYRRRLYQIMGMAPNFPQFQPALDRSIRSFSRLANERALRAQPDRLEVYRATAGETITQIALRLANPRMTAERLAILNRIPKDQPLSAGTIIKVVVRGY